MARTERRREAKGGGRRRGRGLRFALVIVLAGKLSALGFWGAGLLATDGAEAAGTGGTPAPVDGAAGEPQAAAPARVRAPVGDLLAALVEREQTLVERERALESREARLVLFEEEVTAKIAALEEIEKRLAARASAARAEVDAAAESLAKIYAAMKPGDAAPILERLDETTVLTIFGRMKEKQIGEILPLMSREKAIILTQSLADRR